jgi:hypothetical protein
VCLWKATGGGGVIRIVLLRILGGEGGGMRKRDVFKMKTRIVVLSIKMKTRIVVLLKGGRNAAVLTLYFW